MSLKTILDRTLEDGRRAARHLVVNRVLGSHALPRIARSVAYNAAGVKAQRSNIYPGVQFLGGRKVTFGRHVMVNVGVVFDASAPISIGDRVHIGPGAFLGTSSHEIGGPDQRAGDVTSAPIAVGQGAWIGARAVVLPGVTIGEGAVVAAGALVVSDVPSHALVGGVPARLLRMLNGDSTPGSNRSND